MFYGPRPFFVGVEHLLWLENMFCGHRTCCMAKRKCSMSIVYVLWAIEHVLWLGRCDDVSCSTKFSLASGGRCPLGKQWGLGGRAPRAWPTLHLFKYIHKVFYISNILRFVVIVFAREHTDALSCGRRQVCMFGHPTCNVQVTCSGRLYVVCHCFRTVLEPCS